MGYTQNKSTMNHMVNMQTYTYGDFESIVNQVSRNNTTEPSWNLYTKGEPIIPEK